MIKDMIISMQGFFCFVLSLNAHKFESHDAIAESKIYKKINLYVVQPRLQQAPRIEIALPHCTATDRCWMR